MKVSDWLRQYEITGIVPDGDGGEGAQVAFWSGWLLGHSTQIDLSSVEQRIEIAIKAAEFIEEHTR